MFKLIEKHFIFDSKHFFIYIIFFILLSKNVQILELLIIKLEKYFFLILNQNHFIFYSKYFYYRSIEKLSNFKKQYFLDSIQNK
jgi:hypothetical protein